jgi:hypothetical protein
MKITQLENEYCTSIPFSYQMKISSFLEHNKLTKHFEYMFTSKIFAENSAPVYFPEFMFSETTAKIVYLSNEINALTNRLCQIFETSTLKSIINKYIELYVLAEIYMKNEASLPVKNDHLVIELLKRSYDCTQLCSDCKYVDKDNLLFDAMYKFCSKSY